MQALDLVRRRWRAGGTGFEAFVASVTADIAGLPPALGESLQGALSALKEGCAWLRHGAREEWEIDAAARALLILATETAHGWIGARLAALEATSLTNRRLAACRRPACL